MQISGINNHYGVSHQGISKIKYQGLYKDYPKYAESLIEKLKDNSTLKNFIKDKNVKVVISAAKTNDFVIESKVNIFYKDLTANNFIGFIKSLISKSKKIQFITEQEAYNDDKGMEICSNRLKSFFVSKEQKTNENYDNVWSGLLDWRLERIKNQKK